MPESDRACRFLFNLTVTLLASDDFLDTYVTLRPGRRSYSTLLYVPVLYSTVHTTIRTYHPRKSATLTMDAIIELSTSAWLLGLLVFTVGLIPLASLTKRLLFGSSTAGSKRAS